MPSDDEGITDEGQRHIDLALLVGRLEGALDDLERLGVLVRPYGRAELEAWDKYRARLLAIDVFFDGSVPPDTDA